MKPEITILYIVGQRPNGSYQAFDVLAPLGEGIDRASEECRARKLFYIHCSRKKGSP